MLSKYHCVIIVQIRSFFWSLFSVTQSKYGKIRARKNSVFGTFRTVCLSIKSDLLTVNHTNQIAAFKPFLVHVPLLKPLTKPKSQKFSGVFRRNKMRNKMGTFSRYGSISFLWIREKIVVYLFDQIPSFSIFIKGISWQTNFKDKSKLFV